ncbi:hypothetical protein Esti_003018 [Eimeria stiedai]
MPVGGKQEARRRRSAYAVSSERERRRNLRTTNHDVDQKVPPSTIFYTRPSALEHDCLHLTAPSTHAGDAAASEWQRADGSPVWEEAALREEAQECFRLFDRDGDGLVAISEVATMLRSLGFVIRQDQVTSYEVRMQQLRVSKINFQAFSSLATRGFPRSLDPVKVLSAFELLDREKKGSVNMSELHHLITTLGDKLSEADWQELLSRTLTVRECASPVSLKSGTFLKLFCAPADGEDHWSRPPVSPSPPNAGPDGKSRL